MYIFENTNDTSDSTPPTPPNPKGGYIYVGQYFHHDGKDLSNLTEKKVGYSINVPNRQNALNSTQFTIGYTMIKYWYVDEMTKTESMLHAILPNRLRGEWFEDEDNTLVERLTKFMSIIGGIEQNVDTVGLAPAARNIIRIAKDRSRVAELVGQSFDYTRDGIKGTIQVTPTGEFYCVENGQTYTSPCTPYAHLWDGKVEGTNQLNGWTAPRNAQGRSIDQELALLGQKPTEIAA